MTRPRKAREAGIEHVTRIGVIGDVHTERARLQGVLAYFAAQKFDRILCTGDVPDGPLDARAVEACCEALIAAQVLLVAGNHDRWLQDGEMRDLTGATDPHELSKESSAYLAEQPQVREFETPAGRLLLCHGLGANDMASVQPYDHGYALEANEALQTLLRDARYSYVITGHTHRPMVRAFGNLTIINAGTLLRGHNPCCAVIDFEAHRIEYHAVDEDGSLSPLSEAVI
jgi:predicted phosphodiesterase